MNIPYVVLVVFIGSVLSVYTNFGLSTTIIYESECTIGPMSTGHSIPDLLLITSFNCNTDLVLLLARNCPQSREYSSNIPY